MHTFGTTVPLKKFIMLTTGRGKKTQKRLSTDFVIKTQTLVWHSQ